VAAAGHALASDFWSLCLWRMLLALEKHQGLRACSRASPADAVAPARTRARASSVRVPVLGAMIAPWVVVPLMSQIGWRAAFVVTAASGLCWLAGWFLLTRTENEALGPQPMKLLSGTNAGRLRWGSFGVWAAVLAIFFTVPPTVFVTYFLPRFLETSHAVSQQEMPRWLWQVPLVTDIGQILGGLAASALLGARLELSWFPAGSSC